MDPHFHSSRAMWRRCLASASRTGLACALVAAATLHGPGVLARQLAFPAFSYVTVILVVTDAALGDAIRSCWLAACTTVQAICPAILSLWLIGPARLSAGTTAAVAAAAAFVVALPENTHLVSKRIALGQVVIVYVKAYIKGGEAEGVLHPARVAASTAAGVVASVLAVLLPYPNMARWAVRENCRLYTENASERVKLLVKAFTAEERDLAEALISQAKSLIKPARKSMQIINSKQESMQWETIPFLKSHVKKNPGVALHNLETILRGMENALENCSEFPVGILDSEWRSNLTSLEDQILAQVKNTAMENTVLPQTDHELENKKFTQTLRTNIITLKNLPSLFFLCCLKLLQTKTSSAKQAPTDDPSKKPALSKLLKNSGIAINKKRLMPAVRCSLSLGLAILFGSIYSKENGFWAGLPVAISLASAREPTFKIANVKAQGTVLGTVYGVLGCFVFEKYQNIRFLSLLPWFIFTSFLRQSKMYGQAGGVSAVIGAVLILGRKNFGPPSDFAIARIVETFIGMSCSIMVDMLLQPTRASVLAKTQLSKTLESMAECVGSITITRSRQKLVSLEKNLSQMKVSLIELGKYIEEAEVEPSFWFLPFHSVCYGKLKLSLSKMVDFSVFIIHAIDFLKEGSEKIDTKTWKEATAKMETDLKVLRDAICYKIKCFHEASLVKSLSTLDREYEKMKIDVDLEMGISGKSSVAQPSNEDCYEMMKEKEASFVEKLDVFVGEISDEEIKVGVILSMASLVYCMDGLWRESGEMEKGIKEILQWENPSLQVDLHGISRKLHAINKSVTIV